MSRFEKISKLELEILIENCNFSEDEKTILKMSNVGKSEIQIADKLNISVSCLQKRKKKIVTKISMLLEVLELTNIYVNGEKVAKEELKKIHLDSERLKKILKLNLTKGK